MITYPSKGNLITWQKRHKLPWQLGKIGTETEDVYLGELLKEEKPARRTRIRITEWNDRYKRLTIAKVVNKSFVLQTVWRGDIDIPEIRQEREKCQSKQ